MVIEYLQGKFNGENNLKSKIRGFALQMGGADQLEQSMSLTIFSTVVPVSAAVAGHSSAPKAGWTVYLTPNGSLIDNRGVLYIGLSAYTQVELPYYSKFILIAAYLASYNPARTDRRFFLKVTVPSYS